MHENAVIVLVIASEHTHEKCEFDLFKIITNTCMQIII